MVVAGPSLRFGSTELRLAVVFVAVSEVMPAHPSCSSEQGARGGEPIFRDRGCRDGKNRCRNASRSPGRSTSVGPRVASSRHLRVRGGLADGEGFGLSSTRECGARRPE